VPDGRDGVRGGGRAAGLAERLDDALELVGPERPGEDVVDAVFLQGAGFGAGGRHHRGDDDRRRDAGPVRLADELVGRHGADLAVDDEDARRLAAREPLQGERGAGEALDAEPPG
jgi:hypothetical protein